jgi:hypothetical protein
LDGCFRIGLPDGISPESPEGKQMLVETAKATLAQGLEKNELRFSRVKGNPETEVPKFHEARAQGICQREGNGLPRANGTTFGEKFLGVRRAKAAAAKGKRQSFLVRALVCAAVFALGLGIGFLKRYLH